MVVNHHVGARIQTWVLYRAEGAVNPRAVSVAHALKHFMFRFVRLTQVEIVGGQIFRVGLFDQSSL